MKTGITHGVDKEVVIMGLAATSGLSENNSNWNYDGQCSPFQASVIDSMIKDVEAGKTLPEKIVINEEKYFDARTITQADIDTYGLGD